MVHIDNIGIVRVIFENVYMLGLLYHRPIYSVYYRIHLGMFW